MSYNINAKEIRRELAVIYRQEIIQDIVFFTNAPKAVFYDKLFLNLDLSDFPDRASRTGRRGYSKCALLCAFIVMKCECFSCITDLLDYLNNNLLIAHYCGFNIMQPLPSYWTFDRFIRELDNEYLKKVMQRLVIQAAELGIIDTSFIALDSTPVSANTCQNNPKSFAKNKFSKDNQPQSDKDCRLGVHTASNQHNDMIVLWDSLRKSGYTRSYGSMLRVIKKWVKPEIAKRTARKPKPYERAMYPGQKVQVDVKYVPSECISNGKKYYQYTAVDECTRFCFREMYEEHSTYSSEDFIKKLLKAFPFPIREIQTDNGTEFTTALLTNDKQHRTLFEAILENHDIIYHRIRVATPRHNGKVERQHREDGKRFYSKMRMYSLEDGRKQIAAYNKRSNNIPKVCLKFRSPNEVLEDYLSVMW